MEEMFKFFLFTSIATVFLAVVLDKNSYLITQFLSVLGNNKNSNLYTADELKLYNGISTKQLYLSILGNVFDVTKGWEHYGPGKTYNIFIGCDATRNFVTGEFNLEDISDDIIGLSSAEFRSLSGWLKFYKKQYKKIGKLIGRYYSDNGKLTAYGKQAKLSIENAEEAHSNEELLKRQFPPCNVEWDVEKGSRMWCTKKSGGIERSWIGVPRQLYEPGSETYRCACINSDNQHLGNIKEYDNCAPDSSSCVIR